LPNLLRSDTPRSIGPERATLSDRELATVLAALRSWQPSLADPDGVPIADHFEDDFTPLTVAEIHGLCERLNCGPGAG